MSRVIHYQSSGKQRTRLVKLMVIALRELARQKSVSEEARDLAAFLALALQAVADGIDSTVAAWEKRDYWVKADKFRMEWAWAEPAAREMRQAVLSEDWAAIARLAAHIAQKLNRVKVSENARSGKPWVGAFKELRK